MGNDGFLATKWREISDKIQDQVWFQQIRSKWEELDPKSRLIARTGSLILAVVLLIGGSLILYTDVQNKKTLIEDRQALVNTLFKSQEELRRLRDASPLSQGNPDETWNAFIESKLGAIGIPPESVVIDPEKVIDHSKEKGAVDRPKETMVDATLKKVNVRQLVKLVQALENSGRPAKVKRIQIDTEPDESGYLNLSVTLLGYSFQKK